MMLSVFIQRLKINAFLLFLIPSFAIFGSLLFHNYLVNFTFEEPPIIHKYISDVPGSDHITSCNESNNYCVSKNRLLNSKKKLLPKYHEDLMFLIQRDRTTTKLDDCYVYVVKEKFFIDGVSIDPREFISSQFFEVNGNTWKLKKSYLNKKIEYKNFVREEKNTKCIKNSPNYYFFYNNFPPLRFIFNHTRNLKADGVSLGSSVMVNPFLYGETSISNLVKRYPVNFFFKTLLYLGIILMILYWYRFNVIFKEIIDKKINIYYFLGIGSAICLLIHVYFLGTSSNNEILKVIRKLVLVLFILFELLAQTFLIIKIYNNKKRLEPYTYKLIIWTKIIFVSLIIFFSAVIISLLIILDFPSKVDNILEWNYFIILLFYYLLSSLMWKKNS